MEESVKNAKVDALLKDPVLLPLLNAIVDRRRDAAIGELNWLLNTLAREDAIKRVQGQDRD